MPADGRLLEAHDFFVKQPLLTGESYPVEKQACAPPPTGGSAVFMGTSVISGSARVLVCRTGAGTALGRNRRQHLATQRAPDAFELGIRRFGMLIMRLTVLLVLFVLLVNALFHRPLLESLPVRRGAGGRPDAGAAADGGVGDAGRAARCAWRGAR